MREFLNNYVCITIIDSKICRVAFAKDRELRRKYYSQSFNLANNQIKMLQPLWYILGPEMLVICNINFN